MRPVRVPHSSSRGTARAVPCASASQRPAATADAAIALAASTTRSRAPRKVACSRVAACSRIALTAIAFAASTLRSRQVRRFTKTGAVPQS